MFSIFVFLLIVGPALTCPPDVSVQTPGSSATATWQQPTAGNGLIFVSTSHQSGSTFPLGQTVVTYNYFDTNSGSQVSCSFTVTVTSRESVFSCTSSAFYLSFFCTSFWVCLYCYTHSCTQTCQLWVFICTWLHRTQAVVSTYHYNLHQHKWGQLICVPVR